MTQAPYRPRIEREGQPYVDEPLYIEPKPRSTLSEAVAIACGRIDSTREPRRLFVGFKRMPLRWMTPGPRGKLVPRAAKGKSK